MSLFDAAAKVAQLGKDFILLTERLNTLQKLVEKQGELISGLREENAKLTERVAVLEEGRKTIDAQVESTLTKTVAKWQIENLQEELRQAKATKQITD